MHVTVAIPDLGRSGVLTTRHARSQHGLPILLLDGEPYECDQCLPTTGFLESYPLNPDRRLTAAEIGQILKAGWCLGHSTRKE